VLWSYEIKAIVIPSLIAKNSKRIFRSGKRINTLSSEALKEYEGHEEPSPGFTMYLNCFSEQFLILTLGIVFGCSFLFFNYTV